MKATIKYSPPSLNSYQNVPHAECTTTPTTTTKIKSAKTKVECVDVVDSDQDDNGSYDYEDLIATDSGRSQQWRHSYCYSHSQSHSESRVARGDSMGANLRSNCCQREYKNYCKHVMSQLSSCKRDDIHPMPAPASNERERRQAQYSRDYTLILGAQVKTSRRMKRMCEDFATSPKAQLANASKIRGSIKTTLEQAQMRETAIKVESLTFGDSIDPKSSSQERLSPTALSATSILSTSSSLTYTASSTLKTSPPPCLEDNFSLSNKKQLVMPIEEENRLGNVVIGTQPQFQETPAERAVMTMHTNQHPNTEMKKAPTQAQTQWRHRILSRPTSTPLRVGMEEAFAFLVSAIDARKNALASGVAHINAAFRYAGAALTGNSQTTTTLDCRCFKENSDICTVADRKVEAGINKEEGNFRDLSGEGEGYDFMCYNDSPLASSQYPYQQQRFSFLAVLPFLLRKSMRSLGGITGVPPWVSKLMVLWLLMLTIASPANCWTGRPDVPTNCTFPARWEGSWFLSGYQQSIHIKGSQFSYRGKCAASDGNKYLIVDEKGCHRCLVIYEKHKNVLQYKESECEGDSMYMHQTNPSALAMRSVLKQSEHRGGAHPNLNSNNGHSRLSSSDQYIMRSYDDMNDCPPDFCKGRETLQNLCDQIPGDALLYSLFRESAEPVKCPLKGPFIFTYNRGHGECKSPVSNIESCTEDSRLLLSFQACPDVQGTESTVEELTCLATWKDGNSRYLVGLVSHHHAISNEERYRCFVYEKISPLMGGPSIVSSKDAEYKLAQSGDATCNGLDSAEVGSRIMSLRKPPVTERCDFPAWFKGPRHWHVLMGNAVYNYHPNDGSVHIIKPNGFMETRALCEQINKQTSTEMMAVVHYTTGCQSGFMCMMFYRRDTHVIEIQTGKQASRLEDACAPDHFDVNRMPYITLLASNPDPQICPMEGLYNLRGAIGPPYLTTRHKRNHNNKIHSSHGHHHIQSELGNAAPGSGGESNGHEYKRHATLSFRNTEKTEKSSWHGSTRGLPGRSRRATSSTVNNSSANVSSGSAATLEHLNILESKLQQQNNSAKRDEYELHGRETVPLKTVDFLHPSTAMDNDWQRQRNRRDAPGCITNYKAQRRLWVGCTEPDVIDVRPLCNDDGDEEFSCHGSWSENGTVYIIARHKGTKHGVCLSYRPTENTAAKLVIGDACYRGIQKPPDHHLVANLTVFGKCGETGSAAMQMRPSAELLQWGVAIYVVLLTMKLVNYVKNQR
ncbi:uncharacterized protein LOC128855302 isoform X1 [Anastrepha ludens]|uniref:uncharacterized protein LOC128855302 isoform X1 n=1 Tax=Anastrepha ludens TaxID=28586 RepID=UPI0023AE8427|nr:uncharacterized protein LOC128855302 isoform X1 [Anastrepha ludens]XP_053946061.1 uncharacterized protein LOC128855302 isoform X1 [Anastrepha ludens]